jgi:SPP1 family predicted phage head-tail adaptor
MRIGNRLTNPGELRTKIQLQTPAITADAGGAQKAGWTKLADVWAKWENVHGSEVWASQAVQARQPATVLIRFHADVTTRNAILKGSNRYQIISIDDIDDRHEYLELKVELVKGGV